MIYWMRIKLDKRGRVALPRQLRGRYGLRPGSELEITEGSLQFALRPVDNDASLLDVGGILVHQGIPDEKLDILEAIHDEREERARYLSGTKRIVRP